MKKITKILLLVVTLFVLFSVLKFLSKDIFNIQSKIYEKYPNLQNDFRKNCQGDLSYRES